MVKVTYIAYDGTEAIVDVPVGTTLMEGALQNDVAGIEAVCGGNCYCGTCRIYVSAEWRAKLPPAAEDELAMIDASGETDGDARLACQIAVREAYDGIVVRTPESQT